jgi:hypothetical protein
VADIAAAFETTRTNPDTTDPEKGPDPVRIFVFKSESRPDLQAFAGNEGGSKLPEHHGPWTATAVVGATATLPHNFSRRTIEQAIEKEGFQLWRPTKKATEDA